MTTWGRRAAAATGPAFVVLLFLGNGLSTSGMSTETHPSGAQVLSDFARQASHTTNRIGTAMELLAFLCLMVFIAHLYDVLRRRAAFAGAGALMVIGAVTMLAVKISSGAPFFAGVMEHDRLSPDAAIALNATSNAAFVISWVPYAVFVGATAVALRSSGHLGRFLAGSGVLLAVVGILLAVVGVADLNSANPIAFLLGALWTLAVGVVLTVWPDRRVTSGSPLALSAQPA